MLRDYFWDHLNLIVTNIDEAEERNDAIYDYISTLRNLKWVNDHYGLLDVLVEEDIELSEGRVRKAFAELIRCQQAFFDDWDAAKALKRNRKPELHLIDNNEEGE
jgi:hypothetical protein